MERLNNMSKVFEELKFEAWENFIHHLDLFGFKKAEKAVAYKWEKRVPTGRSKLEHYAKGCKILTDLVRENITAPETAALIISASFVPILIFADNFTRTAITTLNGPYEVGLLDGISVIVEPSFEAEEKLIVDIDSHEVISIDTVGYDYETDLAELKAGGDK